MRSFLISLTLSLIIVLALAAALAWLLTAWMSFLPTFVSIAVVVFVIAFVFNSYRERKVEVAMLTRIANEDIFDSRNTATIVCPCNNNTMDLQLFVGQQNTYTCEVCKNRFLVHLHYEPILQTDPVNLENSYKLFQMLKKEGEDKNVEQEEDALDTE
jgi:ABC-type multidrug transport system fused ATPase/permease subunit